MPVGAEAVEETAAAAAVEEARAAAGVAVEPGRCSAAR